MLVRLVCGLGLAALVTTAASATVTLQDRQQAACFKDAQRLCGEFMPNAEKTEACMLKMKDKVSPGCRQYYVD